MYMNIQSSILSDTNGITAIMVSHLPSVVADHIPVKANHSVTTEVESGYLILIGSVSDDDSELCSCQLPSKHRVNLLFPLLLCRVSCQNSFHLIDALGSSLNDTPCSCHVHHRRCALTQPKAAITIPAIDIKFFEEPYIISECCSSKFSKKPKIRRGIPKNHVFRGASLCFCIAKTGLYGAPYWLIVSSLQSTNRQSPIEKLGIPCRMILGSLSGTHVFGIGLSWTTAIPFSLYYLTNQDNIIYSLL